MKSLQKVEASDVVAGIGLLLIAVFIGLRFGGDAALGVVGIALIVWAVFFSPSEIP